MQKKEQVVVSLTSFPAAIRYAVQAVKSILEGTVLPDKIILYLTASQFPDGKIPFELIELKKISYLKSDFAKKTFVLTPN